MILYIVTLDVQKELLDIRTSVELSKAHSLSPQPTMRESGTHLHRPPELKTKEGRRHDDVLHPPAIDADCDGNARTSTRFLQKF